MNGVILETRNISDRMSPSARAGSEVSPARVPFSVGQSIVVGSAKVLDATAPFVFRSLAFTSILVIEVKIPEFQLGFT